MTDSPGGPLAGAARIDVQCLSCGRQGSFAGEDGRVAGRALADLTRHLVCSACGSRAVKAAFARDPRDLALRLRARPSSASRRLPAEGGRTSEDAPRRR